MSAPVQISRSRKDRPAKRRAAFTVNGEPVDVLFAPHKTLLEVLREDLALTGTKHGCELGECGTCTVLVDGRSILSCLMLGLDAKERKFLTVEALVRNVKLHPLRIPFANPEQRSAVIARRVFYSQPKNW